MADSDILRWQSEHINDDKSRAIIISHAVVLPLAFISVVLRFLSRRLCKAKIMADDLLIIAAMVDAHVESKCDNGAGID